MKSKLIFGMLLVGLLHAAGYLWALHGEDGFGYGCFDQDCYAQSARRIAEGHLFSYAPGLPASTGQTSVLYPFVLAIPAAFGVDQRGMHAASAVLAVVFYLVFLVGWGVVIETLFPPNGPGRVLSAALVSLSGCCGFVAFTQCDQGLWMALNALVAAALATRRQGLCLALLTLAPWVRPEGMMLVVAFVAVEIVATRRRGIPSASDTDDSSTRRRGIPSASDMDDSSSFLTRKGFRVYGANCGICYNTGMEKPDADIYSFRKLRENGFSCVDKTAQFSSEQRTITDVKIADI